jgi:tetratricopeptide (TPR) repeat protein
LEHFEAASKQRPEDPKIHYSIGVTFGNMQDYSGALTAFNQALKVKPDFVEALIGKGVVLAKLGRIEEAKQCAKQVLEMKNTPEQSNCGLAGNSFQKDYEAARARFRKEFSPNQ